jgi:hypothetical protein
MMIISLNSGASEAWEGRESFANKRESSREGLIIKERATDREEG